MKTYAEFIFESLDSDTILLINNSLKKISSLMLSAANHKESKENIEYQIHPNGCGFILWLEGLIDQRSNFDIKKSVEDAQKDLNILKKLEEININCSGKTLLYDFFDEPENLTKLTFSITVKDLLSYKTQNYLNGN